METAVAVGEVDTVGGEVDAEGGEAALVEVGVPRTVEDAAEEGLPDIWVNSLQSTEEIELVGSVGEEEEATTWTAGSDFEEGSVADDSATDNS